MRFGALNCANHFGSSLNRHTRFHCYIIDGVFGRCDDALGWTFVWLGRDWIGTPLFQTISSI